ncbi:MAG: Gfo/Idh/MocA family oxidoreductase [Tepidisphaeraceae bacterium]
MPSPHRIGLISLDTSHVSAFSKLLNDPTHEHHVPGVRVVAGFPGGSRDFPLSIDRVAGFTEELRRDRGVEIVESPEAVAEKSDLVFLMSCDGRVHRSLFERIARFDKPVFIDKPLATTSADAKAILDLAKSRNLPLMSCSSLRYAQGLSEALANGRADILGCDVFGPLNEESRQTGFFWYGVHTVEMMIASMGVGCVQVRCLRMPDNDQLIAVWNDGRVASIRGLRNAHGKFGITLHRKEGPQIIDASAGRPYYAGLLRAILASLPNRQTLIPQDEMLHVVKVIEAINVSRSRNGEPVAVA